MFVQMSLQDCFRLKCRIMKQILYKIVMMLTLDPDMLMDFGGRTPGGCVSTDLTCLEC